MTIARLRFNAHLGIKDVVGSFMECEEDKEKGPSTNNGPKSQSWRYPPSSILLPTFSSPFPCLHIYVYEKYRHKIPDGWIEATRQQFQTVGFQYLFLDSFALRWLSLQARIVRHPEWSDDDLDLLSSFRLNPSLRSCRHPSWIQAITKKYGGSQYPNWNGMGSSSSSSSLQTTHRLRNVRRRCVSTTIKILIIDTRWWWWWRQAVEPNVSGKKNQIKNYKYLTLFHTSLDSSSSQIQKHKQQHVLNMNLANIFTSSHKISWSFSHITYFALSLANANGDESRD